MSNVFSIANKFQYCLNSSQGSIRDDRNAYVGTDRGILAYFFFALLDKICGENSYDGLKESFDSIAHTILHTEKVQGKFECVIEVGRDQYGIKYDSDDGCVTFSKVGSWQSISVPGTFNGLKEIVLRQYLIDKKRLMENDGRYAETVDLSEFYLNDIDSQVVAQGVGVKVQYINDRTTDYGQCHEINDASRIDFEDFDFKPDYFCD